jgi:hypothetical protein
VESGELQRVVERGPECDGVDATYGSDLRKGWAAQWSDAGLPLKRQEHAPGGVHSYRDHQGGAVLRKLSDSGQGGRVEVVSRREVMQSRHWANAFGLEAKDRRYYELIEDTIHDEFDYRYFVVRDAAGEIRAVQPCFVLDLDLLVGAKPRIGLVTDLIRRVWPRFMRARTLMLGCAAGEGHIDGDNETDQRASAQLLASAILDEARRLKTRLIVLKEFPAKYRSMLECFVDADFARIPSLPNVLLNIDYASFEDYMTKALSGGARRKLRLKLKAAECAPKIEMSEVRDIAPMIDEVYPLYLAVYNRSSLHFEKLTKEYFCGLGQRMGDKNRFFIWRQGDRIVAFGSCLLQGDTMHAEYLGLDYSVAIDLHLYHYTFRDLVSWGIANGYKWFHSSALNYDPKLHLRYKLDPVDLYVRHTSPIFNAVFARILPWLEPTRYDKTLKQFANYHELWAPSAGKRQPRSVKAFEPGGTAEECPSAQRPAATERRARFDGLRPKCLVRASGAE